MLRSRRGWDARGELRNESLFRNGRLGRICTKSHGADVAIHAYIQLLGCISYYSDVFDINRMYLILLGCISEPPSRADGDHSRRHTTSPVGGTRRRHTYIQLLGCISYYSEVFDTSRMYSILLGCISEPPSRADGDPSRRHTTSPVGGTRRRHTYIHSTARMYLILLGCIRYYSDVFDITRMYFGAAEPSGQRPQ